MISNFITLFIVLGTGSLEKQADALLSYIVEDSLSRHETRVGVDNKGNIWLVDNYQGKVQVTRITRSGKPKPEKVAVFEASKTQLGNQLVFDDFNTLAFTLAGGSSIGELTPLYLFQITKKGIIRSYDYWPFVPFKRNYLERLPADTLLIVGGQVKGEVVVSKGVFTKDTILPAQDTTYLMEDLSMLNVGSQRDYYRSIIDWNKGWGLRADIQWYSSHMETGPENVSLAALNLGSDGDYTIEHLGIYSWRNFIWRTYEDAWMRYLTFSKYRDGGYIMAISDPKDRSNTHLVRLDDEGIPIDPATLEDGGSFSSLPFKRLPSNTQPHADISMWGRIAEVPDSAHLILWGLDKKGNLYSFRKVDIFSSE